MPEKWKCAINGTGSHPTDFCTSVGRYRNRWLTRTIMSILQPIAHLGRYRPSDAAGRIWGVTLPTWDEVDVSVKDRLPGGSAAVHADIETGDGGVGGAEFFL